MIPDCATSHVRGSYTLRLIVLLMTNERTPKDTNAVPPKESDIRKQMKTNEYIDERSVTMGENAEVAFDKAMAAMGCHVQESSKYENRVQHIDRWMVPEKWVNKSGWRKQSVGVEVKGMKRISRRSPNPQSEWLWIEFKNVVGGAGWLYGDAMLLATEVEDGFYLLYLKSLRAWAEWKVDRNAKVQYPNQAKYKSYSRKDRDDVMSLVRLQDFISWYEEKSGIPAKFVPKVLTENTEA